MSLSRPVLRNPASCFMQWGGGAEAVGKDENGKTIYEGGKVSYWDKEANDGEGGNIEVALPLTFIVLDELSTITGFNKATNSGFWSNEVKNLTKEELVVRNKNGVVARGKYKDIADEIKSQGAKYTKSIYIAFYNDEKELVLGNLKLAGAAMSEWINFQKRIDVSKAAVTITVDPTVKKNGTIYYFVPAFDSMKISTATLEAAKQVDAQLQDYLDVYFARDPDLEEATSADDLVDEDDNTDIHNVPGVDSPAEPQTAPQAAEKLADGTSTDSEQDAPAKPSNKPATAAKAKTAPADPAIAKKLNDVEF